MKRLECFESGQHTASSSRLIDLISRLFSVAIKYNIKKKSNCDGRSFIKIKFVGLTKVLSLGLRLQSSQNQSLYNFLGQTFYLRYTFELLLRFLVKRYFVYCFRCR